MKAIKIGIRILVVIISCFIASSALGQVAPQFSTVTATVEKAIQLQWRGDSNAVYRLECTSELSDNTVWDTLVDSFPAQGTNTMFLDTGKYWTDPPVPHPKDAPQRFYRLVVVGTNTLAPPGVTITNLSSGTNVFGEVEIDVHVSTTDSVASVDFFVDGEQVESASVNDDGNASYIINTTEWPNGPHVIFAVAETSEGTATTGEFQSTEKSGAGTSAIIPATFDNYISKWYFSLPGFDASLGETQHIMADLISYSDWTLEIVDPFSTTVRTVTGSGINMMFDWDGTDDFGSPTSDETYDYVLTATQTTAPLAMQSESASTPVITSPTELLVKFPNGNVAPCRFIRSEWTRTA